MKKLLAFLLILVCFSSLTACKEDPLDNVNTDSNNSSTQEQQEEKQIPIQSFDGRWKECNLRERESSWTEIIIDNGCINVYWTLGDSYGGYHYEVKIHEDGTWENPSEEVTEYSYISKFNVGYYIDENEVRHDHIIEVTFTYKNGKLSIARADLTDPYMYYRDSDVIYFERISD